MKQSKHIKQPGRHRLWVRYKRERIDCCPQTSCVVCVLTVTTVIPTMLLSISNFKESLWGNSKWQCKMKWRIDLWAYKWKKKKNSIQVEGEQVWPIEPAASRWLMSCAVNVPPATKHSKVSWLSLYFAPYSNNNKH